MNLNWKQLMDFDTGRIVLLAIANAGAWALLDAFLHTVIALLTIWYLWRKIHPDKNKSNLKESEDENESSME
jgi:hypothetical protein